MPPASLRPVAAGRWNRGATLKIGILNYADVRNFGDVLFPLIIAREIRARIPSAQLEFINPTGSTWSGMSNVRLDMAPISGFDAVILGGGEVVHRYDGMLAGIYSGYGLRCIDRPTDLVFSWTEARGPFKAWFGIGVPPLTPESAAAIAKAASSLDFIGVRGTYSARRIGGCTDRHSGIVVSPDLGWLLPRLLEEDSAPPHPAGGLPYIAVQSLQFPDLDGTTNALRRISDRTGLKIVLLPLTRCWRDHLPLSQMHQRSEGEFFIVDDAMSDLDKLSILGRASMYLGQSMHGFIGAMSQGRVAGVLQPTHDNKFGELLDDADLRFCAVPGWDDVECLTETLSGVSSGMVWERRRLLQRRVDSLFDDLCEKMLGHIRKD